MGRDVGKHTPLVSRAFLVLRRRVSVIECTILGFRACRSGPGRAKRPRISNLHELGMLVVGLLRSGHMTLPDWSRKGERYSPNPVYWLQYSPGNIQRCCRVRTAYSPLCRIAKNVACEVIPPAQHHTSLISNSPAAIVLLRSRSY